MKLREASGRKGEPEGLRRPSEKLMEQNGRWET
jgi:hypothetical protein